MIDKNKDHDAGCGLRDAGCESGPTPMNTGGSARGAEGEDVVQSPMSKADPVRNEECGVRNMEYLRSKTEFCAEEHPPAFTSLRRGRAEAASGGGEGWTPNGESRAQANIEHPTSNTEHRMGDGDRHLSPALSPIEAERVEDGESRTTTRTRTKTEHPKGWTPNGECPPPHIGGYGDEGLLRLRPYQREVFRDHWSGVVVLHWSRQIGKSYVLAAWAVYRLLSRPGRLVTVLSNSKENGSEFLLKCAEVCRLNGTRFETVIRSPGLDFEDMRMELRIRYKGKLGRIKVLAANPRTARGFSGDLILDEFAFHEDGNKIWEAAEPILASNKDFLCRIASTGNGKRNLFYRMTEGNSLATDSHGLAQMGKGTDKQEILTADKTGSTRMEAGKEAEYGTSVVENPTWSRIAEVVPGMIVDGMPYFPGSWSKEQIESFKAKGDLVGNKTEGQNSLATDSHRLTQMGKEKEPGQIPFTEGNRGNGEAGREKSLDGRAGGEASQGDGLGRGETLQRSVSTGDLMGPYFVSKGGFKVSRVTRTMAHSMGLEIYDAQTREAITPEQARAQALDKGAYDQNYECSFADESLALLSHELISAAECEEDDVARVCEQEWTPDALELMRQAKSPLYAGLDVGRKVDLSVLTVLERVGGVFYVRGLLRMRNMRLPDQEMRLKELCRCRQVRQVCIDMTGLGLGLFEYAQRTMGEHMISGINFSSSVSATKVIREEGTNRPTVRVTEAMAMEVLRVYEDRRIRQPRDWELREDLRRPGKVTTPAGRVSIAATRDGGGHADHFWSVALALEAAGGSAAVPFAYEAIKLRSKYANCGL